jgi:AraC-like DNA-binding protein
MVDLTSKSLIAISKKCKTGYNNYSVTHACFESGFNNLSYFNRQFKQVMKVSPQQYQKWKKAAVLG